MSSDDMASDCDSAALFTLVSALFPGRCVSTAQPTATASHPNTDIDSLTAPTTCSSSVATSLEDIQSETTTSANTHHVPRECDERHANGQLLVITGDVDCGMMDTVAVASHTLMQEQTESPLTTTDVSPSPLCSPGHTTGSPGHEASSMIEKGEISRGPDGGEAGTEVPSGGPSSPSSPQRPSPSSSPHLSATDAPERSFRNNEVEDDIAIGMTALSLADAAHTSCQCCPSDTASPVCVPCPPPNEHPSSESSARRHDKSTSRKRIIDMSHSSGASDSSDNDAELQSKFESLANTSKDGDTAQPVTSPSTPNVVEDTASVDEVRPDIEPATASTDELAAAFTHLEISEDTSEAAPSLPLHTKRPSRPRARIILSSSEDDEDDENDGGGRVSPPSSVGADAAPSRVIQGSSSLTDSPTSPEGGSIATLAPPTTGRRRLQRNKGVLVSSDSSDSSDEEETRTDTQDRGGEGSPAAAKRAFVPRNRIRGATKNAIETITVDSDDSIRSLPPAWASDGEDEDDSFIVYTSEEEDDEEERNNDDDDEDGDNDDDEDANHHGTDRARPTSPDTKATREESSPSPPSRPFRPLHTNTPQPDAVSKRRKGETPARARSNFMRDRDELTLKYYEEFNARAFGGVLPPPVLETCGQSKEMNSGIMPISWSKTLNTTAGTTRLKRLGGVYAAEISLSTKVVDEESRLRSTLCHEMCHAAAFLQDHVVKPPHGAAFKKWAARAMRAYPDLNVSTCHSYQINFKHQWKCQTCRKEYGRHSNSIDTTRQRCGACSGELKKMPRLKSDGTPAKTRQPSKWISFCQENMARVKKNHSGATHADIMEVLSREYRARSAAVPPTMHALGEDGE